MKALYIETSAILCWLFGEPDSKKVTMAVNTYETILTSSLTIIETKRAMIRAETEKLVNSAAHQKLKGIFIKVSSSWNFLDITGDVRKRASMAFPVEPVRSLDAIHLATALEFLLIYPDMAILTFDKRILDNCIPLGLQLA